MTAAPYTDPPGALTKRCSQCWQVAQKPCWPYGTHLARYEQAARDGHVTEDELQTARDITRDGVVWQHGWRKRST